MDRDTYGSRLRRWRELHGLSRSDLARELKVTRQTILGWETDRWLPTEKHEAGIARAFGLPAPPSTVQRLPSLPSRSKAS